ncbi:hypothetical protein FTO70_14350 [Methanosarcina sp. KYL-1]|uniref:hypothetical protein n=1 Tax=Methanosarcina sp. KYL-1 TaxID=2602068 RepID=UPI002100B2B1|nr:hypothetical protein [Methanosarcina sp. KYL-1]MCQ1536831.1 hypothetical protein [Methanosarcina sp. KYL-1]
MSAKTEKRDVARIKELIEHTEQLQKEQEEINAEIKGLLRKKYPSISPGDMEVFKWLLDAVKLKDHIYEKYYSKDVKRANFSICKTMFKGDLIIYDKEEAVKAGRDPREAELDERHVLCVNKEKGYTMEKQ